jgi:hypothetical protein
MYSLISFVNFFPIFVKIYFTMKRVLSLLAFVLLLSGCDDGNLIQEDINFETATTQNCSSNDLIYKLKEKEALILEIPSTSFTTEPSSTNTPTEINISTSNRVVYRFYNGTVSTDTTCNA